MKLTAPWSNETPAGSFSNDQLPVKKLAILLRSAMKSTNFSARAIIAVLVTFIACVPSGLIAERSLCACTPLWHCLARSAVPTGPCTSLPAAAVPQTYVQCCPRSSSPAPDLNVNSGSASTRAERTEDVVLSTRSPNISQDRTSSREVDQSLEDNGWAQCGRRGESSASPGVAAPHEWPWHAAILEEPEDRYVCGASLISATWLLSAAHCVVDYLGGISTASLKARLGELDVRTDNESPFPIQERRIAQMLPHPGFDARTLHHDAALLRLASPASAAPNVGAVCLPSPPTEGDASAEIPEDEDEEAECYVTGWGRKDESSSHSQVLKSVRVPLWRRRECDVALKPLLGSGYHLPEAALCAGAEGRDACDGDGGGPLVCRRGVRWAQVGIVSFGVGCGRRNSPGVYTSVTRLARWVAGMTGAVLPTHASPTGSPSTARPLPADPIDERPSDATTIRTSPRPQYPYQVISYGREPANGFRSLHVPDPEERARQTLYALRYGSPRNGFSGSNDEEIETTSHEAFEHVTTLSEIPTTRQPLAFVPTVFRQVTETSTTVPNELDGGHVSTSPFNSLSSTLPASRGLGEKLRRTEDRGRGSARSSNSRGPTSRRFEPEQYQISTSTYRTVTTSFAGRNDTNSTVTREEPLKWEYGVVINHPPSQKNGTTERTTTTAAEATTTNGTTTPTPAHPPPAVAARPGLASNLSSSYSVYRIYPSSAPTRLSGSRKATPPSVRPPSKVSDDRQPKKSGKSDFFDIDVRPTVGSRSSEDLSTTTTTTLLSSSSTFNTRNGIQVATTFRASTEDGPASTDATTAPVNGGESGTTENTIVETTTTGYVATPASQQADQVKTTPRERLVVIDRSTSLPASIWVTPRAPLLPTPVSPSSTTSTNRPVTSVVVARGGRRYGSSRSRISWQTDSETSWNPNPQNQQPPATGVRHAFHPGLRKLPGDDEPDYDELQEAAPLVPHIVRSRPRSRPPPPAAVAVDEVSKSPRTRSRSRTWNQNTAVSNPPQRSSRRNNRERIQEIPVSPSTSDPFSKSRSSPETWISGLPLSTVTPSAFATSGSSSSRSKEDEDSLGVRLVPVRVSKIPVTTTPSSISEDDLLTNRAKNEQSSILRSLSDEALDEGDVYAYLNAGRGNSASRRRTTASGNPSTNRRPRTRSWDASA